MYVHRNAADMRINFHGRSVEWMNELAKKMLPFLMANDDPGHIHRSGQKNLLNHPSFLGTTVHNLFTCVMHITAWKLSEGK